MNDYDIHLKLKNRVKSLEEQLNACNSSRNYYKDKSERLERKLNKKGQN